MHVCTVGVIGGWIDLWVDGLAHGWVNGVAWGMGSDWIVTGWVGK